MSFQFAQKIGLGTWRMGESARSAPDEIKAIEHAFSIGYRLIDTAEMYGDGGAEIVTGKALQNIGRSKRSLLTVVSKVLPYNSSTSGVVKACEASLRRLGCDYLDVYLLHWKGSIPFEQTLEGFQKLKARGLIKHHGVSNFDVSDLKRWIDTEKILGLAQDDSIATNQVYYALSARGIEFDLIPKQRAQNLSLMAYSPIGTGELSRHKKLIALATSLGVSAPKLALSWVIRQPGVVAIPKSVTTAHLQENWSSQDLSLDEQTLNALDQLFPPPASKSALAVI